MRLVPKIADLPRIQETSVLFAVGNVDAMPDDFVGVALHKLLALRTSVAVSYPGLPIRTGHAMLLCLSMLKHVYLLYKSYGTPGWVRTNDPLLKRQVLLPAELRRHIFSYACLGYCISTFLVDQLLLTSGAFLHRLDRTFQSRDCPPAASFTVDFRVDHLSLGPFS